MIVLSWAITYWIDASEINTLAEKLFTVIPKQAIEEAKRKVALEAQRYIMAEAPIPISKAGRIERGPLWSTVTIDIVGDGYSVGPTKKVSGHWDLASIIEFGSAGGQILRPRTKKVMKFFYKGKMWFRDKVRRGSIAPNPFVLRARNKLSSQIPAIVRYIFISKFLEVT